MATPHGTTPSEASAWNHNIEYHRVLLDALPDPCGSVLDVGCGDGDLAGELADRAARVLAVDRDGDCVARAAARLAGRENVEVRALDVMTADLPLASFDAVVTVAVLHHLELRAGLVRLASLVAPGGMLGVVGLARSRTGYDLAHDVAGAVLTRARSRRHGGYREVVAPMQDPDETYAEVLKLATLLLPGVRYRRHALFRYSLVWARPDDWEPPT